MVLGIFLEVILCRVCGLLCTFVALLVCLGCYLLLESGVRALLNVYVVVGGDF